MRDQHAPVLRRAPQEESRAMSDMADREDLTSTRFGERLRRARQAAGLTQAELAERAGLSVRGINDLERGARQHPRRDTVALLAQALGLAGDGRVAFEASARDLAARHAIAPEAARSVSSSPQTASTALPTGTVTFLFTDIEGSTRLLQQLGSSQYAVVQAQQRHLLQGVLLEHSGHEVDSQGDSCFSAFATAGEALAATVAAQRSFAAQAWPAGAKVRVRMGLHTGAAQVAGERYIGLDVHRAARIAAAGHGGQVLLSEATRALVEPDLPAGLALRDLGAHRLKDLQRPEHLWQLVLPDLPGLPTDFPPLATLDAHPNNLPVQLTSFVGRERELEELPPLLLARRLLTLTGPGGTGKTRLALRLAVDVVEAFADGVWLVELAPLADPSLVPHTVAGALGVREQPGSSILDVLVDALRPKSLLLVLDNCEHLIAACAQLAEQLLRAAPNLHILASGREALGIAGETVYRTPSLPLPSLPSLPDPDQPAQPRQPRRPHDLDALARNDCVRLFVERAAATHPAFHLTTTNTPVIAEIGRRLDGIPLAIELAAARARVLPPEQIAARLDDRFRLLTGGSRTALPRHQTLLALIEWSHELLSEPERVLLRRLSVFAGGWSLGAAQAVCGEELGADVLDTLAHLVDKSLIDVEDAADATEGRYRLLETIRQYAHAKLVAAAEVEPVSDRHLEYCIRIAEEAAPYLRGVEQLAWVQRLEREHDNLRTAMAWALETDQGDRALQLAGALAYLWELRGYWSEGHRWLNDALALAERERAESAAAADPHAAPLRAQVEWRARALYGAARLRFAVLFEPAISHAIGEESLRLWRALGDTWWMAVVLEHVGFMSSTYGDVVSARATLEEGVELARQVEDRWPLARCLVRLGSFMPLTEPASARAIREEAVAVSRSVGDRFVLSQGLFGLAVDHLLEGNIAAAEPAAAEALEAARAIGSVQHVFLSLIVLVSIACEQGDLIKARDYGRQVLASARALGSPMWLMLVLFSFGLIASFGDQHLRGVRLLAAAETLLRNRGIDIRTEGMRDVMVMKEGVDDALTRARAQFDAAAVEAAWAEGRQLTVEQALALVTEGDDAAAPLPAPRQGAARSRQAAISHGKRKGPHAR
jgi:predicted ATPase/class 3 adenylate cyclase